MPCLCTGRLILREYQHQDLPGLHCLLSDRQAMHFIQDIATKTLEESRENLAFAMESAKLCPRTHVFLAVEHRQSGAYMGSMGYTVTGESPVGLIAEAGYFFLPEFHSKGYAPEAFAALLDYAFTQGNVFRMTAGCFAKNHASARVMEKCGLMREAHYHKAQWLDGAMQDRYLYAILKEDWARLK